MTATLTAWNDAAVDAQIERMLARIVQAVRAQMVADLEAILLAGGFGRGEGGVLRKPDGSIHIVNDFDVEIVYRESLGRLASKLKVQFMHRRALAVLAEKLADEFDMKQVDLTLRGLHSMAVERPRLADFDMRHGHRLLWGATDPCDAMRRFRADEIDPFEGTWLLRNRAVGLVLARLYLEQPGALRAEHCENFYIEINKSALAMGDALWILSRRYDVSYAKRKQDFSALAALGFPGFDELAAAYDRAAEYKLRPVEDQYPGEAPIDLWQRLAAAHVRMFLWFESARLGTSFDTVEAWCTWADRQPRAPAGGALRRAVDRYLGASGDVPARMAGLRQDKLGSVACAIALLSALAAPAARGAVVLGRWRDPASNESANEPAAWQALARGLLNVLHPGGEVGRFLRATGSGA